MSATTDQRIENRFQAVIQWLLLGLVLTAPLVFHPHLIDFSNLPKKLLLQLTIGLAVLAWLPRRQGAGQVGFVHHPVLLPIAGWLLWSCVTLAWAADPYAGFFLWVHWLFCAAVLPLVLGTATGTHWIDRWITGCVISAALVSCIGLVQYVLDVGWIPQAVPPAATFANKNMAVQFVAMAWPLSVLRMLLSEKRAARLLHILFVAVITLFLVVCKTRAGWAAVGVAVCLMIGYKLAAGPRGLLHRPPSIRRWSAFILALVVLAGGYHAFRTWAGPDKHPARVVVSTEEHKVLRALRSGLFHPYGKSGDTAQVRLTLWHNTLAMVADHPLSGVGLANWPIYYPLYHRHNRPDPEFGEALQPMFVHNDFLQVLAETGWPGMLLCLCICLYPVRALVRIHRHAADGATTTRALFLCMSAICFGVNACFSFPLRMAIPPFFLMLVLGMLMALERQVVAPPCPERIFSISRPVLMGSAVVVSVIIVMLTVVNLRAISADRHYRDSLVSADARDIASAVDHAVVAVQRNPWQHLLWFQLGKAHGAANAHEQAVNAYQRALALHPNHYNSLINMAARYLALGDPASAENAVRKAMEILPDSPGALLLSARILEQSGRLTEARDSYAAYLKNQGGDPVIHARLGVILYRMNRFDEAEQALKKALAAGETTFEVHYTLGSLYAKRNRTDAAAHHYRLALGRDPRSARVHNQLGLLAAQEKKWAKAVGHYQKGMALDPAFGVLHLNLAVAYWMQHELDLCLHHAQTAKSLGVPQADTLLNALQKAGKTGRLPSQTDPAAAPETGNGIGAADEMF